MKRHVMNHYEDVKYGEVMAAKKINTSNFTSVGLFESQLAIIALLPQQEAFLHFVTFHPRV